MPAEWRPVLATLTQLLTAEDLFKLPSDRRCELVDGVVIDMSPPGGIHGKVAVKFAARILNHVEAHELGTVVAESGFILRRGPDTVRGPDVAFVKAERLPPGGEPVAYWGIVPDLVVEVISPGDTAAEIQARIREWIEAGVPLLWIASPRRQTVEVIRSLQDRVLLGVGDVLDGGDVLPGFTCPVADLFG
jgi:Uma2 family endonuclease